jgi:hypothetical protein
MTNEQMMLQMTKEKARKFNDHVFETHNGYIKMSAEKEALKQQVLLNQQFDNMKRLGKMHKSCSTLEVDFKKKQIERMETVMNNK